MLCPMLLELSKCLAHDYELMKLQQPDVRSTVDLFDDLFGDLFGDLFVDLFGDGFAGCFFLQLDLSV